mgnify:FL=1
MELTRIKNKLAIARKGHKLLKDKRDELMRQFMIMVRENMDLRLKVEHGLKAANINFVIAKAAMDEQTLNAAFMSPKQEITLDAASRNVMSVNIPVFEMKTKSADAFDIYSYGFAFTSGDLDAAVGSLADVMNDMITLAEKEKACQLMAAEIERTRRRVNALEHVVIPEAENNIKYISMKLEETARDNTTRLIKVKDMVLEDAHHYKQRRERA